jgi:hypothetical protein
MFPLWMPAAVILPASPLLAQAETRPRSWPTFQRPLAADELLVPVLTINESPADNVARYDLSMLVKKDILTGFTRFSGEGGDIGEQLRNHWREAIRRRLPEAYNRLESEGQRKVDTAIELVITRFLRDYRSLQAAYEADGPACFRDSVWTEEYNLLRKACSQGLWASDPLLGHVLSRLLQE